MSKVFVQVQQTSLKHSLETKINTLEVVAYTISHNFGIFCHGMMVTVVAIAVVVRIVIVRGSLACTRVVVIVTTVLILAHTILWRMSVLRRLSVLGRQSFLRSEPVQRRSPFLRR